MSETDLGVRLLAAALTNELDQVDAMLAELTTLTGNRVVYGRLAAAWIDACLVDLGIARGTEFEVLTAPGGPAQVPAELPDDVLWCARAITARVAGDVAGWSAMLFALPAEDSRTRRYLRRMLTMLAITMRQHHRAQRITAVRTADQVAAPVAANWSGRAAALRGNSALN
jgi:hypothetical protein